MCSPEMNWHLSLYLNGLHCKVSWVESLHTLTIWWFCIWSMDHFCSNPVTPTCLLSKSVLNFKIISVLLCESMLWLSQNSGIRKDYCIPGCVSCQISFYMHLLVHAFIQRVFIMHILRGRNWQSMTHTLKYIPRKNEGWQMVCANVPIEFFFMYFLCLN